jgi:hypothetical protein
MSEANKLQVVAWRFFVMCQAVWVNARLGDKQLVTLQKPCALALYVRKQLPATDRREARNNRRFKLIKKTDRLSSKPKTKYVKACAKA